MMKVGNLQVNTLKANSIKIGSIEVNTINGVTNEEMANLSGVKGNIQYQLDKLSDITSRLNSMKRTQATDDASL